ncbi:hypothetical protein JEQ12_013321 [Ovis aries]|uniref:Uncharacterized protein n=1 Tax=Ovis aries TaxID=9940 RepID=A0A835ZNB7_SHEEP|nr:hypothetical protein JEQ12_013321 [Ovis aries]
MSELTSFPGLEHSYSGIGINNDCAILFFGHRDKREKVGVERENSAVLSWLDSPLNTGIRFLDDCVLVDLVCFDPTSSRLSWFYLHSWICGICGNCFLSLAYCGLSLIVSDVMGMLTSCLVSQSFRKGSQAVLDPSAGPCIERLAKEMDLQKSNVKKVKFTLSSLGWAANAAQRTVR